MKATAELPLSVFLLELSAITTATRLLLRLLVLPVLLPPLSTPAAPQTVPTGSNR